MFDHRVFIDDSEVELETTLPDLSESNLFDNELKLSADEVIQAILVDITRLLSPTTDDSVSKITKLIGENTKMNAQLLRLKFQAIYYASKIIRAKYSHLESQNAITRLIFKFFELIDCVEEPYFNLVCKGKPYILFHIQSNLLREYL